MTAPYSRIRHDLTAQVVGQFFQTQQEKDLDAWLSLWNDRGVFIISYPADGFPDRIEGKAALAQQFRAMFERYESVRFHDIDIQPLLDADRVVVTWTGEVDFRAGGTATSPMIALFTVSDGKILRCNEYFDPRIFAAAH
jgi:uncharacterized protein